MTRLGGQAAVAPAVASTAVASMAAASTVAPSVALASAASVASVAAAALAAALMAAAALTVTVAGPPPRQMALGAQSQAAQMPSAAVERQTTLRYCLPPPRLCLVVHGACTAAYYNADESLTFLSLRAQPPARARPGRRPDRTRTSASFPRALVGGCTDRSQPHWVVRTGPHKL